ncbi:PREDICTED: probable RNA-binding protein ARP1 [Tarenaya hassleriana]|uniref:probable RNA-binding protein ARP1 n=1 Tax=Tarenaya hassleriana TaxID=28532 RepID=UPI00053C42E4|nr:PREDICTED: probable RNA-binding protein ARP1 [Tarenaya hassleriana]
MAYQSVTGSGSGFHYLNSPFGDTTFTKVFVGGLAWETQSETLRRHFEQYGEILEAVVITDKNSGRSKGYGFVTFRDPESARRACADPTPIIDGRRANCNLASLGRPRPHLPFAVMPTLPGRLRPASPYVGGVQGPRGPFVGNFQYQQPLPYSYQQGVLYPYGIAAYGPDYMYSQSQGMYGPYMGQQYLQVYGVPGTVNTPVYPYGQLSQTVPGGHGYTAVQGYTVPGSHLLQLGGSSISAMGTSPMPAVQSPFPQGMPGPGPAQPHIIVQAPQFMQSSGSDQTTG